MDRKKPDSQTPNESNDTEVQHRDQPIFMLSEGGEDHDPIQSALIDNHSHYLQGEINYDTIGRAIQWIIAENVKKIDPTEKPKQLTLYINSSGGDLYNAFALIDMMHCSKYPVATVGIGNVMSAAALILACGQRGHRYVARHAGIMMHQFYSDMEGKEHELQSGMRELQFCRDRINGLLINYCRISKRVVEKKLLRPSDAWLTAEEAVKLKLADKVFTKF